MAASLFEGILKPFSGIINFLNSPLSLLLILLIFALGFVGFWMWVSLRPEKKILYFSEDEHIGSQMDVKKLAPAFLHSKFKKLDYRFVRFRPAYNFQIGGKSVTRWLAKSGTAYTKRLETGEVGEFTLYRIMQAVWGNDVINELQDEQKQKLIKSEVMLTVRLEEGKTPVGYKQRSESYIKKESDQDMAAMFGENVKRTFSREDWIRSGALIGSGIALCYIAQAMGLLGGVA
jgi:hypothetical protein